MIHFTPIQEIGESGSAYCIYDQHSFASTIFPNQSISYETQEQAILEVFGEAEKLGVLTLGNENSEFIVCHRFLKLLNFEIHDLSVFKLFFS